MSVLWQQRTHGVQRRKEQQDRTLALAVLVVVVVVSILAAAYLSVAAANVQVARRVWEMEEELAVWERDNQALMVEIARYSSIPVLQQRAVELGYVPAESVDYLIVDVPEP